jgi:predicted transcriptional regulator
VLKTMQRLESKGLLSRVGGKGPVRFRAAVEEQRVMPALIRRFIDRTLGGAAGPLVAYLADMNRLSLKDAETLRAIAKRISEQTQEDD